MGSSQYCNSRSNSVDPAATMSTTFKTRRNNRPEGLLGVVGVIKDVVIEGSLWRHLRYGSIVAQLRPGNAMKSSYGRPSHWVGETLSRSPSQDWKIKV